MFFSKKKKKREGAISEEEIIAVLQTVSVNDGLTVERINWDGSTTIVSGRVSHVGSNFEEFVVVEEGSGEGVLFKLSDGDIARIQRMAISIDIDETHTESYLDDEHILEMLEALDHGDVISVAYYDPYKGKGDNKIGAITLKDEYNKIFSIEYEENGEMVEKTFDLTKDKIIDIIIM